MRCALFHPLGTYEFDTREARSCALPITAGPSVAAFHLPPATFEPFRAGTFVGSVELGGPCRCDVVTLAPHGNGTHTECIGHVAGAAYRLIDCLRDHLVVVDLVTVDMEPTADGMAITAATLSAALPALGAEALMLRTRPNTHAKRLASHSGQRPGYVAVEAMAIIHERGVVHLLVDLPSVDPEEDAGALAAHRLFWQWPDAPRPERTITELIYVDDTIPDGRYALQFNAAAFDGDAAPSWPVLYPLVTAGVA